MTGVKTGKERPGTAGRGLGGISALSAAIRCCAQADGRAREQTGCGAGAPLQALCQKRFSAPQPD